MGGGLKSLFVLRYEHELPEGKGVIIRKLESSAFPDLHVNRIRENEFHLSAKGSLGVGGVAESISFFRPIAANAVVHVIGDNEVRISFASEIRVELVVIGLVWLLVFAWAVVLWFSDVAWHPEALILIGVLPLVLLWFRFVYRVQEEHLITSVLKRLKQS